MTTCILSRKEVVTILALCETITRNIEPPDRYHNIHDAFQSLNVAANIDANLTNEAREVAPKNFVNMAWDIRALLRAKGYDQDNGDVLDNLRFQTRSHDASERLTDLKRRAAEAGGKLERGNELILARESEMAFYGVTKTDNRLGGDLALKQVEEQLEEVEKLFGC